jgi:hypothetical protein
MGYIDYECSNYLKYLKWRRHAGHPNSCPTQALMSDATDMLKRVSRHASHLLQTMTADNDKFVILQKLPFRGLASKSKRAAWDRWSVSSLRQFLV